MLDDLHRHLMFRDFQALNRMSLDVVRVTRDGSFNTLVLDSTVLDIPAYGQRRITAELSRRG